jgi:hypothetical protein
MANINICSFNSKFIQNFQKELLEMGASESDVVNLFHSYLFPDLKKEGLKKSIGLPMSKHTVPNTDAAYTDITGHHSQGIKRI